MSEIPVLISTRQAAAILGLTVRTVARMADGEQPELPPAYRFDNSRGAYLFRESDVHELRRRRSPGGPSPA